MGRGRENRSTCRVENLNYALPVVQAKSRGGLTAKFALNYNSQMWRKDLANNGNWYYGRDNGYGHGWRLMAGSILPYTRRSMRLLSTSLPTRPGRNTDWM